MATGTASKNERGTPTRVDIETADELSRRVGAVCMNKQALPLRNDHGTIGMAYDELPDRGRHAAFKSRSISCADNQLSSPSASVRADYGYHYFVVLSKPVL
jgi:hypothetical protein